MYSYVPKDTVKPCKALCFECLAKAQAAIKERYGITFQIYAVGSGSNNLVTRWNNEPFDMDFNVLIQKLPDEFANNPKKLKDTFRRELDTVLTQYGFSNGQDSTSAITYTHRQGWITDFMLDIGLADRDNNGDYFRLIHKKTWPEQFIWNQVQDSRDLRKRTDCIRKTGRWNKLSDQYLAMKNQYGRNSEQPSFLVYVEAANLVWQSIPEKERIMSKGHVSGNTHSQSQMNHHANQSNPNNAAHQAANNNHANQMNPNNSAYKGGSKK